MTKQNSVQLNTYSFTIVLDGMTTSSPDHEDKLFAAGCDDALLCAYGETLYLQFDRESESAESAINSAIKDIESAGAKVRSIQEAGYSSKADIANFAGVTRAAINKYFQNFEDHPEPVFGISTRSPLYSLPEVSSWLHRHDKIEKEKLDVSIAAREVLSTRTGIFLN